MTSWAWANYPDIDPVESMQKHTSINPKAGIWTSFDLDLFSFETFPTTLVFSNEDLGADETGATGRIEVEWAETEAADIIADGWGFVIFAGTVATGLDGTNSALLDLFFLA